MFSLTLPANTSVSWSNSASDHASVDETPDGVEGRLRVTEFLTSIPAIGQTKSARIMDDLAISTSKRLGGLGRLQRRRLREFVADWVAAHGGTGDRLVVLAGPTAVGKGTVASFIRRPDGKIGWIRLSVRTMPRVDAG